MCPASKRLEKQIQDMQAESESKKMEVCWLTSSVWTREHCAKDIIQVYQLQTQMQQAQ